MTPLEIEILMHYHCRAVDHESALNPPSAQKEAFSNFVKQGYLVDNTFGGQNCKDDGMMYSPKEKLHIYCEAICNVPEPKQVWVV